MLHDPPATPRPQPFSPSSVSPFCSSHISLTGHHPQLLLTHPKVTHFLSLPPSPSLSPGRLPLHPTSACGEERDTSAPPGALRKRTGISLSGDLATEGTCTFSLSRVSSRTLEVGVGGQRRGEFPAWEEIQCPGQGLPPFSPLLNFFAPHPWCLSLWRQQMAGLGGVDEAAGGRGDLSEAPAAFPHLPAPKVQSGITALKASPAPAANTWGGERTRWGSGGCGRILCPATRQIWARDSLPGPDLLFAPPR